MNKLKLKISATKRFRRAINRLLPTDTLGEKFYVTYSKFYEKIKANPDACVLELGSRNVRNVSAQKHGERFNRESYKKNAKEYVGFDYHPGENVDVVGDIHNLSRHLPQEHFDAVFSGAVFEHLAMPWKAVLEINKVMKKGGLLYIETHPAWPPHELPWDFWRYQKASFSALLNKKTGFKIIECVEGERASIVSYAKHLTKWVRPESLVYLYVAVIAEKISAPDVNLSWDVDLDDFAEGIYPPTTAL